MPIGPGVRFPNKGSEVTLSTLDPDQYQGTLGLLADAPKGALKPHYTGFPAANAGAWVRVVSDTKIGTVEILTAQEWMCTEDNTPANSGGKWELVQTGAKKPQFATYASCIGEMARYLDAKKAPTLKHNVREYLPFTGAVGYGVFANAGAGLQLVLQTYLVGLVEYGVHFDISALVYFQSNLTGDRSVNVIRAVYYPEGTNPLSLLLESSEISYASNPAAQRGFSVVQANRFRLQLPVVEPLDEKALTYTIGVAAKQTSGDDVAVSYAEQKIVAWK